MPDNCEINGLAGNQLSIYIDRDLRGVLTTQDSLRMISPDLPIPYLEDPNMGWHEFSEQMLEDYKVRKGFDSGLSSWEKEPNIKNTEADTNIRE